MQIQEIQPEEIGETSLMIKGVFSEFISNDYTVEGVFQFESFVDEQTIKGRLASGSFMFVAKNEESIVGAIEIKDGSHIPLFYVKKGFQRKGLGKKLFKLALKKNSELNPSVEVISVNSSPFAVDIYKSLGFRNSAAMQVKNGIRYFPMQYKINYF